MFQYTTETIINSNVGNLPGGKRFGVIGAGDAALQTSGITSDDYLVIDGVNSLKIEYIKKIYRTVYRASANATATLDLSGATIPAAGKIVRLTVVLREQGSVRSTIQNAYLHKSKPFHYELAVPSAASGDEAKELVAAIVKLVKKDMAMTDFAYFKAAIGTGDESVVLTADDCYIQFVDVKLEEVLELEDSNTPLAAKLLGSNVTAAIPGISVSKTPGDEGQGTVARLVKNLRIPTNASINPFAADQGGKPVPGGQYDQFLIEYETPRAHVSGTVMGSVGEISRTSHVFFIESGALSDWNTVLGYVTGATGAVATSVVVAGKSASNPGVTPNAQTSEPELTSKEEMGSVE